MTPSPTPANTDIGDFRLIKMIGMGGMGIVYSANQKSLNRTVALKMLGSPLTGQVAIARFRRAAQAAAKLTHPGIAQIYFIGQDQDQCYMAMEYVEGVSLDSVIGRLATTNDPNAGFDETAAHVPNYEQGQAIRFDTADGPINCPETTDQVEPYQGTISPSAKERIRTSSHMRRCCEIIRDAAIALAYAHTHGVIHRDIKPGNLMLGYNGRIHIIDFGIARLFEDTTLTNTGQLVGTPMYMSPEQITGRIELDPRTDIYSLGLVFYELLTLQPAILAPTREQLLRRIVTKALEPVSRINDSVPPDLESIVHKATSKDPDDRYQDASAFADDLANYLAGKPIVAKPYRFGIDAQEMAATRPNWITIIGPIVMGLGLLGIASVCSAFIMGFLEAAAEHEAERRPPEIDAYSHTPFGSLSATRLFDVDKKHVIAGAMILALFILSVGMYITGRSVLYGRNWARLTLIVVFSGVTLVAPILIIVAAENNDKNESLLLAGFITPFLLVCVAVAVRLYRKDVREWCHFCARLRADVRATNRKEKRPSLIGKADSFPTRVRRRLRSKWARVAGLLVLIFVYAAWPGCSTHSVSPETTYITGPLDNRGFIDYPSALNESLGKGITPDSNANVLIWRALGPRSGSRKNVPSEYFTALGIEPQPEEGDYFLSRYEYIEKHLKDQPTSGSELVKKAVIGDMSPWTANEEPELADWLRRNEKSMALLSEATRRPDYYSPHLTRNGPYWWESGTQSPLHIRDIAEALRCRAMLHLGEGRVGDAGQDLLTCHRLGRLIARGGNVWDLLTGFQIDQIAARADVHFVNFAPITSKDRLAWWAELQRLPSMPAVRDYLGVAMRLELLGTIMLGAREGAWVFDDYPSDGTFSARRRLGNLFTRSINWDPAFRAANHWMDRWLEASQLTARDSRNQGIAGILAELEMHERPFSEKGFVGRAFMGSEDRGEAIGYILIRQYFHLLKHAHTAADKSEQRRRNLTLAWALAAYRHDTGVLPAKLEELVPKYMATVPDDLFSGKPLIYRLDDKGYLLYSVGPDGIDQDGKDTGSGGDVSIHVSFLGPANKK